LLEATGFLFLQRVNDADLLFQGLLLPSLVFLNLLQNVYIFLFLGVDR